MCQPNKQKTNFLHLHYFLIWTLNLLEEEEEEGVSFNNPTELHVRKVKFFHGRQYLCACVCFLVVTSSAHAVMRRVILSKVTTYEYILSVVWCLTCSIPKSCVPANQVWQGKIHLNFFLPHKSKEKRNSFTFWPNNWIPWSDDKCNCSCGMKFSCSVYLISYNSECRIIF